MSKRFILLVVAYWLVGTNLITMLILGSMEMFLELLQIDKMGLPEMVSGYWLTTDQYIESTIFGFLFALLFLFIHHMTEKKEYGRMSFGKIILMKSVFYVLGFIIIFIVIYFVITNLNPLALESVSRFAWTNATLVTTSAYLLILFGQIVFLNFVIQADKSFGHSKLINFLTGKYHEPVIEDRVFLFIDLKDSTTFAERLGNVKYSMLIKDCFEDLNTLLTVHKAEIYQYVGDEVVVTWPTSKTLKQPYCVDLFFAFKNLLGKRDEYYRNKFGVIPEFKAA